MDKEAPSNPNIKEQQNKKQPKDQIKQEKQPRAQSLSQSSQSSQDEVKSEASDHSNKSESRYHSNSKSQKNQNVKQKDGENVQKQQKKVIRYKYCCKVCKHPDKTKKACVCVVPLSQRRAELGDYGCRNCGCKGCSKQDYISKGEDPEYKPSENAKLEKRSNQNYNKDNRDNRQNKDHEMRQRKHEINKRQSQRSRSRNRKRNSSPKRKRISVSPQKSLSPEIIDAISMKFYNFDRSIIGNMIVNEFQLNPNLLGFGIPQRSYSYILGKPQK